MRIVLLLNIFLLTVFLSLDGLAKPAPTTEKFGSRSYEIFIPPAQQNTDTPKPAPTIFVLHGGRGSAKKLYKNFDLSKLAADAGAVLVYPNGIGGHWNDGRPNKLGGGRRIFKGQPPDDVAFLSGLAQDLVKRGIAKQDQIYVAGVSNGGMMTQRLLCDVSDTFSAGAVMIANLPVNLKDCKPAKARPVLFINGDADPLMPWNGGGVGFRKSRGLVLSGMDTFAHWQKLNGCAPIFEIIKMANKYARDKSQPVRYKASCKQATEMIRIKHGGHHIPMPITFYRPKTRKYKRWKKILGRYNHDFDAREEIWDFFFSEK